MPLQDVVLLSMAGDKIGGDTIMGGWTIPHPLSLGIVDDANAKTRQIILDEPWEVVM